jgi:hypothetical protein
MNRSSRDYRFFNMELAGGRARDNDPRTWAGGVSFRVDTEKKFKDMVAWLKLE